MLWLVVGLPVVVVVASIGMVRLALRDPADATSGSTRRIAQVQLEDRSWDYEAARQRLHAELEATASAGQVRVRIRPQHVQPMALTLAMRHAIDAAQDRTLSLARQGDTWVGHTTPWKANHAWNVQLAAPAQRWRVSGRLAGGSSLVDLVPQVAP